MNQTTLKVKDLIPLLGGNTKFRIVDVTRHDIFTEVYEGIVDDIDFHQIPYGDCEIESMSIVNGEDNLLINIIQH